MPELHDNFWQKFHYQNQSESIFSKEEDTIPIKEEYTPVIEPSEDPPLTTQSPIETEDEDIDLSEDWTGKVPGELQTLKFTYQANVYEDKCIEVYDEWKEAEHARIPEPPSHVVEWYDQIFEILSKPYQKSNVSKIQRLFTREISNRLIKTCLELGLNSNRKLSLRSDKSLTPLDFLMRQLELTYDIYETVSQDDLLKKRANLGSIIGIFLSAGADFCLITSSSSIFRMDKEEFYNICKYAIEVATPQKKLEILFFITEKYPRVLGELQIIDLIKLSGLKRDTIGGSRKAPITYYLPLLYGIESYLDERSNEESAEKWREALDTSEAPPF